MRCSIFRSLPVLPPPPRKEPRGYLQPAFCLPSHAQLPDSSRRKAPRGLASLLFTGGRRASSPPRARRPREAARALHPSVHLGAREPPRACSFLTASHVSARAFHVGSGAGRRNVARKAGQGQGPDLRRTPPAPALGDSAPGTGRGAASHPSAVRRTVFWVQRF